jgi:hypothetical protein
MKKIMLPLFILEYLFVVFPVMGQDFFVPPLINLSRFSFSQDERNPTTMRIWGLPNMRIWGWAKDKIAYSVETEDFYDKAVQFYVKDLVTDEFVFSYVTEQFRVVNDYYSDIESLEDIKRIVDGFDKLGIQYFNNDILPFPIKYNNEQYKCTITFEYNTNIRLEKNFVKSYSISVEMPGDKLFSKTFTDLNYYFVELCGYFINPSDNKIVIVICEKWNKYNTYYKFIGVN